MNDQRRFVLAIALSGLVLLGYMLWTDATAPDQDPAPRATPQYAAPSVLPARDDVLVDADRQSIPIKTDAVRGSINLTGARFDDLELVRYRQTVEEDSPAVVLLQPSETREGYFAAHMWVRSGEGAPNAPGIDTPWRLETTSPSTLTTEDPVVLSYTSEDDLFYRRTIAIDENYLFTITDEVTNNSATAATLQHIGAIRQNKPPEGVPTGGWGVLFEGPIGVLSGEIFQRKYNNLAKDQRRAAQDGLLYAKNEPTGAGGWLGFTDKYWLTALIAPRVDGGTATMASQDVFGETVPAGPLNVTALFQVFDPANAETSGYAAMAVVDPVSVGDGETLTVTSHFFAGAKNVALLRDYAGEYGIEKFKWAVDWGRLAGVLTQPFFDVLHAFGQWTGSYGLAILLLTIVIKALFFPLANASYKSMAKMKKLQPKVTKMRERYKEDPQGLQRAMMELYRKEKVNPLAGCLPLIPQMFVFFALYKTLIISLEMRHEPFIGWIKDLSARDPSNMWNLFGLLPYDPAMVPLIGGLIGGTGFLAIGAWALLMGISMWAMQTLNPPPPDPMQARIFGLMPIIFTFVLAPFAVGLVIYWTWNNTLSFLQQYIIIRRQGVDTPIGSFLSRNYKRIKSGEVTPSTIKAGIASRLADGARFVKNRLPGAKS